MFKLWKNSDPTFCTKTILKKKVDVCEASPNNAYILTTGVDVKGRSIIKIFDIETGISIVEYEQLNNFSDFCWFTDDKIIIAKEKSIGFWCIKTEQEGKIKLSINGPIKSIAYNPKNNYIAIGTNDEVQILKLLPFYKYKLLQSINIKQMQIRNGDSIYISKLFFTNNGSLIITVTDNCAKYTSRRWDLKSNKLIMQKQNDFKFKSAVKFGRLRCYDPTGKFCITTMNSKNSNAKTFLRAWHNFKHRTQVNRFINNNDCLRILNACWYSDKIVIFAYHTIMERNCFLILNSEPKKWFF